MPITPIKPGRGVSSCPHGGEREEVGEGEGDIANINAIVAPTLWPLIMHCFPSSSSPPGRCRYLIASRTSLI